MTHTYKTVDIGSNNVAPVQSRRFRDTAWRSVVETLDNRLFVLEKIPSKIYGRKRRIISTLKKLYDQWMTQLQWTHHRFPLPPTAGNCSRRCLERIRKSPAGIAPSWTTWKRIFSLFMTIFPLAFVTGTFIP